jgi:transposase
MSAGRPRRFTLTLTETERRALTAAVHSRKRHEPRYVEALLARGHVLRAGRGCPRVRPERLVGDKGYSYRTVRRALARRGIGRRPPFDRAAYRERKRVERPINRLEQYRRIATRYEQRAWHYTAMLTVAAVLLWL